VYYLQPDEPEESAMQQYAMKMMSLRVPETMAADLKMLSEEESVRRRERVTPSDLVRDLIRQTVKRARRAKVAS
jgi:hypothetical protein